MKVVLAGRAKVTAGTSSCVAPCLPITLIDSPRQWLTDRGMESDYGEHFWLNHRDGGAATGQFLDSDADRGIKMILAMAATK